MKSRYAISIPKPCHENWSKMTPNEKGRFCQSCSKTVVDFTKMNMNEVQAFIHHNKDQRICGHIKQNQLDAINLQVSETVFEQHMSFHKLFLLALLLVMGTSLFSCSDENGRVKKIESVEIIELKIDSAEVELKQQLDSTATCKPKVKTDSVNLKKQIPPPPKPVINGMIVTGEIIDNTRDPIPVDLIIEPEYPEVEGEMRIHDEVTVGLFTVQSPPEFKDTPKNLDIKEKREFFQQKISNIVNDNFLINPQLCLDLSGRQKIYVQFTIDRDGYTKDIKTRGSNLLLEKEAIRVIKLLPQFVPPKHEGKPIEMIYSLPIIFEVKD
ncbi:energy transducer TonB [Psychroserpens luteolus]|uniref:energy transducer TonB n=1 Tax=Psychroserpens luteolus TaxID=2855840 RepID=UPI001E5B3630|nr:energy transducer TonB [Psychroserpens luteolus]MCD2258564.1 energy transducer TonB [Psychroserpens luteolus]